MACASAWIERTDHELVAGACSGDVAAFGVLVDRYRPSLVRHLAYRTGDPELAADLAQEAFIDAFRHLGRLSRDGSFDAWLHRIALNRLRMVERRHRLRRFVSFDWLPEPAAASIPALREADASERCHERDLVQRLLAELSPPLREALLLHGLEGFTAPEVAAILGLSLAASERRISRAKQQFRERYRALNENGKRP